MNLYRITKAKYANDLSGTGGLHGAGRWHREGTQIVYTSNVVSLAMLEVLGHWRKTPVGMALITIQIPNTASITVVETEKLSPEWQESMYPKVLADITDEWIREGKYWLMRVPSIHTPAEFNYLMNPLHPEHQTVNISSVEPYGFDIRLKN